MSEDHAPYHPGMTLGPGQSTTISVPIPEQTGQAMQQAQAAGMQFRFEQVPPPEKAPHYEGSEELGLLPFLRAEKERDGGWRCDCCNGKQKSGATLVWVPDGVSLTDSPSAVSEMARAGAFNGSGSGWCLPCARLIGRPQNLLTDHRFLAVAGVLAIFVFLIVR